MNIIEHDFMLRRWNSIFLIFINPNFTTISRRKTREFDELILVFKELENSFMKLEELHVKEMKEDGRKLMEAGRWGEEMRMKKTWDGSREIKIISNDFAKLHNSPSTSQVIPIKSLKFQFNQFNPYPHNISITKFFSWKKIQICPYTFSGSTSLYYLKLDRYKIPQVPISNLRGLTWV